MPQQLCKRRFLLVAAVHEPCSEFTLSARREGDCGIDVPGPELRSIRSRIFRASSSNRPFIHGAANLVTLLRGIFGHSLGEMMHTFRWIGRISGLGTKPSQVQYGAGP
jgi:hypothetical protein